MSEPERTVKPEVQRMHDGRTRRKSCDNFKEPAQRIGPIMRNSFLDPSDIKSSSYKASGSGSGVTRRIPSSIATLAAKRSAPSASGDKSRRGVWGQVRVSSQKMFFSNRWISGMSCCLRSPCPLTPMTSGIWHTRSLWAELRRSNRINDSR
jgi:hypothetical protein